MKKVIEIETIDKHLESFHDIISNSIELEYPLEHHVAIYYDTRTNFDTCLSNNQLILKIPCPKIEYFKRFFVFSFLFI
jgi:hypothetical protein